MKESGISDRRIEHPDVNKKGQELRERSGFLSGVNCPQTWRA